MALVATKPDLILHLVHAYYLTNYCRWPTQETIWSSIVKFILCEPCPQLTLPDYVLYDVDEDRLSPALWADLTALAHRGHLVTECGELRLTPAGLEFARDHKVVNLGDLRLVHMVELDAASAA